MVLASMSWGLRPQPSRCSSLEDRSTDAVVELVADREPDVRLAAVGGERVRRAADVRPDEDLAVRIRGGELLEREGEHREVILRRVRARAAGPNGAFREPDRGRGGRFTAGALTTARLPRRSC